MNEQRGVRPPGAIAAIQTETAALGFQMASDLLTGSLLRTLAASRPASSLLELGTGTGLSAAWILDGMDAFSTLVTVDSDPDVVAIARRHLGPDSRVTFNVSEGAEFLGVLQHQRFDFIFADTWPGKYDHLDEALSLLKPGAFYIIDDMNPQPNWPDGHAAKVERLIAMLEQRDDLVITKLDWSTGIVICTKKG